MPRLRPCLAALLVMAVPLLCSQFAAAQSAPAPIAGGGGKQPSSSAASNITAGDTRTTWAPQLPTPAVNDAAAPIAFLAAARTAIAANRTGEAQEALERAESRALDRSVRPSNADQPSRQPLVAQIAQARQALGAGDRMGALTLLQTAIENPEARGTD